jgi:hypothetical protein
MQINEQIIQTILTHYPQVQAVYLFGSIGTEDERRKILAAFAESGRAYDV